MARKLFKSFAIVTLIGVITRLFSFVFRIYLSRKLGAEALGVFQIASSIFMLFACFASSGIPVTLSRKTAQYDAIGDFAHSNGVFTTSLIISTVISLSISCFFYIFPSTLSLLFTDERCNEIFIILLPALLSTGIYCTIRAWFWGKKQFVIYSSIELVEEILLIIITSSLLALNMFDGAHNKTVALSHVIGEYICVIILIILFIKKGGKVTKPLYIKEVTQSSTPITTTRLFTSLVSSAMALLLPTLLVKSGLSISGATAEYGRMSGMVMPIIMSPATIVGSLAVVMIPELASEVGKRGMKSISRNISKSLIFSMAIACAFLCVFVSCGEDIGLLLYDDLIAGKMLSASCIIMLPLVCNQLLTSYLNTLGKENYTFITNIVSSVVLISCILILPKYAGIMAYPIGLGMYHTIGLIMNTIKIRKTTEMSLSYIKHCIFIILMSILASVCGVIISKCVSSLSLVLRAIITCAVSGGIYGIATLCYIKWVYKVPFRNVV